MPENKKKSCKQLSLMLISGGKNFWLAVLEQTTIAKYDSDKHALHGRVGIHAGNCSEGN